MAQPFSTFGRGVQALAPGVTVLFKRGDTWFVPSGTLVDINGGLMGAFDSGPRPRFRLSGGSVLQFVDSTGNTGALYDAQIVFE